MQVAVYKGDVPGHEAAYALDHECVFQAGCSMRVSGNTAAILSGSWLAPHFEVRTPGSGVHDGRVPRVCRLMPEHALGVEANSCVLAIEAPLCSVRETSERKGNL